MVNWRKWIFGYGVMVLFSVTSITLVGCKSYETAKYKKVEDKGKFEIRDYEAMMMVSVPMKSEDRRGGNQSFRKLFDYISKGNEKKQKIAMTTPVFGGNLEDESKMYFVLPSDMKKEAIPKPVNQELEIVSQKKGRYVVYKYSGRAEEADRNKAKKKLLGWLKEQGIQAKGEVIWAGYDPPWTPGPARRNEALVLVGDSVKTKS